jgi:hypothetical protein
VSGKRIGIFIGLAVIAAAVGLAMTAAGTGQNPTTSGGRGAALDRRSLGSPGPGWRTALEIRSDALNQKYGLGRYAVRKAAATATTTQPEWLRALEERSAALDQKYGLGATTAHEQGSAGPTPDWLKALEERSRELDRRYGLGH